MQTRIQNQSVREVLRWLNQPEERRCHAVLHGYDRDTG